MLSLSENPLLPQLPAPTPHTWLDLSKIRELRGPQAQQAWSSSIRGSDWLMPGLCQLSTVRSPLVLIIKNKGEYLEQNYMSYTLTKYFRIHFKSLQRLLVAMIHSFF